MKIGIFTDTFYPEINGVATSCLNLERELRAMGHEVHVYAPRCKGWKAYRRPGIHYLPSIPFLLLTDRNVGVPGHRSIRQAVSMNFDVVHTNSEFAVGFLGQYVARVTGCTLVHTYHTVWEDYSYYLTHGIGDKTVQRLIRKYSQWWCGHFDAVIAPTEKTRALLRQYKVTAPISVIPSGLDLARFSPERQDPERIAEIRRECGVQPGERVLLYIGRIAREKNLEQVLRAFAMLPERFENVRFVVVGEGPQRRELQEMASCSAAASRITFTGPKPWERIEEYYAIAEVFVSASRSETQGLTYIEAMASGLRVCAADDPCLENVITNGVNGVLVGESDEEMLEGLIQALDGDNGEMGENAVATGMRYSARRFAEDVNACYLQAMESVGKLA